jgi:hypothetical protein
MNSQKHYLTVFKFFQQRKSTILLLEDVTIVFGKQKSCYFSSQKKKEKQIPEKTYFYLNISKNNRKTICFRKSVFFLEKTCVSARQTKKSYHLNRNN